MENAVAFLLTEEGWTTELTSGGSDGGIDVKCIRPTANGDDETLVVQVKHFSNGAVGAPVVRQLLGAALMEGATNALVPVPHIFN